MNKEQIQQHLDALKQWVWRQNADLLVIVFLLALAVKYLNGAMQVLDIDLFDETDYLYNGLHLLQVGFRDASWSPFMGMWYALLALFTPDRITLYYLNIVLLLLLPAIAAYILLRVNHVGVWVAWAASLLIFLLRVNLIGTQHTVQLALLCILVTCIFVSRAKSTLRAMIYAALGALVTMYTRPEHTITFLILAVVLIAVLILQWRSERVRQRLGVVGTYAIAGLALFFVGNPFRSPLSTYHSLEGFAQHFWVNWLTHYPNGEYPWHTNWALFRKFFPTAQTLPQAILENPGAFLQHVEWNIRALIVNMAVEPFTTVAYQVPATRITEILFYIAVASLLLFRYKTVWKNIKARPVALLNAGTALAVALLSTLVTMPRTPFLIVPISLATVCIVLLVAGGTAGAAPRAWQTCLAGLFLLALVPSIGSELPQDTPNLASVRFVSQLQIQKPVTLLVSNGFLGDYFSDNYTYIFVETENPGWFTGFVQENNVNMFLVRPIESNDVRFQNAPGWQQFIAQPSDFGFVRYDIPKTKYQLYIAGSLLNR